MSSFSSRKGTAFMFLILTVALMIALNILETSNSESIFNKRPTRTVLLSTFSNNYSARHKMAITSNASVNFSYSLAYTEKKRPLIRVYDHSREYASRSYYAQAYKYEKAKEFEQINTKPTCKTTARRILWYDIYHNGNGVRNRARKVDLSKCDCRCVLDFFIFNDTSKVYAPYSADAVLIQLNKMLTMTYPPLKRIGQVFVAVEREATPGNKIPQANFEGIFNWTMTYRRDSDIFYPYGKIVHRREKPLKKNYDRIYRLKKKAVVWFVSHCITKSKREQYAEELNKYIDVDIVGKCGELQCPKKGKASKACIPNFEEQYFFRFAFENTYHTDYVTEKLFQHFSSNMVQIVGGSANYTQIVPSDTVINAKDFNSPKHLAAYLKFLMSNKTGYIKYLQNKENYYAEGREDQSQKAYCQLCSMLHNPTEYRNSYHSVGDWWIS